MTHEIEPDQGGATDSVLSATELFNGVRYSVTASIITAYENGRDVAELLSLAVTEAATEIGGTEELLKYRSGSWEAAAVRQLVGCQELMEQFIESSANRRAS